MGLIALCGYLFVCQLCFDKKHPYDCFAVASTLMALVLLPFCLLWILDPWRNWRTLWRFWPKSLLNSFLYLKLNNLSYSYVIFLLFKDYCINLIMSLYGVFTTCFFHALSVAWVCVLLYAMPINWPSCPDWCNFLNNVYNKYI